MYKPRISGMNEPLSVASGQTGQFTFHFVVPRSLRISDAKICYEAQQPYSYGELSGGDMVLYNCYEKRKKRLFQ